MLLRPARFPSATWLLAASSVLALAATIAGCGGGDKNEPISSKSSNYQVADGDPAAGGSGPAGDA
ncbi:MAG: hypothetical protein J5I93_02510, partial [Pirellulaceae bacterium]|nr:hypothetical protein [Pirellulaceae bacterium]